MPRGRPDFIDVGRDLAPSVASANQRELLLLASTSSLTTLQMLAPVTIKLADMFCFEPHLLLEYCEYHVRIRTDILSKLINDGHRPLEVMCLPKYHWGQYETDTTAPLTSSQGTLRHPISTYCVALGSSTL